MQRGAVSAGADLEEPVAQGEATGAATEQAEEEEPTPHGVEAHESDGARAPSVAEATEVEVEALRTSKAVAAGVGAPRVAEFEAAEASLGMMEPAGQDADMGAGQASVPPLVQGPPPSQESARGVGDHSIPFDDTSPGKGVTDVEAASAMEQPTLTSGEGSAALVRAQPEPRGWDHPRVLWRSRDDP